MPSGLELGRYRSIGGLFRVHIWPDDKRRVAAQLQRKPLHGVSALLDEQAANAGGAGERERTNTRFAAQNLGDFRRLAQYHVEDAFWDARSLGKFCQRQRRERRFVGGLHNHRAACGQRGSGFAGDHRQWEVPRRNHRGNAHRLFNGAERCIGNVARDGLAVGALALFREPTHETCAILYFTTGIGQRFALLQGHDGR